MQARDRRLSKIKTKLVQQHPFFGQICMGMDHHFDEHIPTAAVNGKWVKWNPAFVDSLRDNELMFVMAHECMHPMLGHNFRRGTRDPRKWNEAGDYVINYYLTLDSVGTMPQGGLYDEKLFKAGGGTSEGIYALLPDEGRDNYMGREDGAFDSCEDAGGGTPAEQAQAEAEWKAIVAQAAHAAKMAGKMSEAAARLVDDLLQSHVPWQQLLEQFLVRHQSDERSYARLNRRFLPQGLYLPSRSGWAMGDLVFAIDCSGSVDNKQLAQFAAELRQVKEDMDPRTLTVVYFDSEVCHVDTFTRDDDVFVEPHGGGGTAFSPVFAKVAELGVDPDAIVVLTDLYCSDFGTVPDWPVMWVTTGSTDAPFGEVVPMK